MIAYTLQSKHLLHALEDAARRGARVRVRLEGAPYGDPDGSFATYNRRLAIELRRSGAVVHVNDPASGDAPLHAKALAVDGKLFLDDRNWARDDVIVRDDDPGDSSAVRSATAGRAPSDRAGFAMHKRTALQLEARMLERTRAGDRVTLETETFGSSNAVCRALDDLGKRGLHPRLLVERRLASNGRERATLQRLATDGVEVRTTTDTEKFAVCGRWAWIGSANASPAFGTPDEIDWGTCTRNGAIVAAVAERLEMRWLAARPLDPSGPP